MLMLDTVELLRIISGQRTDFAARIVRIALRLLSLPYALAIGIRNRRFDSQRSLVHRLPVPVISVGNITTGGTGKTPMVAYLAKWLRQQDVRVTLLSRGYGVEEGVGGGMNDEALELADLLPDVPHLQNKDRVAAGQTAVDELDSQLILLDDGFQHRRLYRDLDIVLLDASEPFGYGRLLPAGLLREPLSGLRRADVIVLTRADMVDDADRVKLRNTVQKIAPRATWIEATHEPQELVQMTSSIASSVAAPPSFKTEPISSLQGRPVAAFCGIGNPAAFRHMLNAIGFQVTAFREFPDHHQFRASDIDELRVWIAARKNIEAVVCTRKDLVKIQLATISEKPLWAVGMRIKFRQEDQELLEETCRRVVQPFATPARTPA